MRQVMLRLLLVEDDPAVVRLLRQMLAPAGEPEEDRDDGSIELSSVSRLGEAMERLGAASFDAVLLDLGLPDSQGLASYRRLRDAARAVPIVILSALQDASVAVLAVQEGAQDYLVKSHTDGRKLRRAIRQAIERKRVEGDPQFFKYLIDQTRNPIFWLTPDEAFRFMYVNEAACRHYGYPLEALLQMSLADCDPNYPAEACRKLWEDLKAVKSCTFETVHRRSTGEMVPVEVTTNYVAFGGREYIAGTIHDITERKRLEDQLRQSQKMEAIGRLAGGIAHDFNNMLTVIMGHAEIMLSQIPPSDPLWREIGEIKQAGERASLLTTQLLAFSRQQHLQPQVLNLNEVVVNLQEMLRRLIGSHIMLVTKLDPALKRVRADQGQLVQVIMNLAVNAKDAMPEGGTLTIETRNVDLHDSFVRLHPSLKSGPHVKLTVWDTGCGMDAATLSKIFEPFFTTKAPGKGTGLGLSTVYGIVRQSGGSLEVNSEPGRGATFQFYFPPTEATVSVPASPHTLRSLEGTETVLLVEDEAKVRELTRRMIEKYGYVVVEANDGAMALQLCTERQGRVDLMLTDMVMPGMNGQETVRRIQRLWPGIRALYMSGYPGDAGQLQSLEPDAGFLRKPFTSEALVRKIRECLDGLP
jgi:PAS domain S-box-containing protein